MRHEGAGGGASPGGASVPSGADSAGDPLGCGVRFGFGGSPGHVREGGLPPELVGDAIVAIVAILAARG